MGLIGATGDHFWRIISEGNLGEILVHLDERDRQVGTTGTPAMTRVSVSPRARTEVGTTGDKWGHGGTGV